jgi:aminoglycoside 3-N-acetyltransferase
MAVINLSDDSINYLNVSHHLRINKGDILYVGSDITRLVYNEIRKGNSPDLNKFIDSLIEEVGDEGTLIVPTFNWDFCKGVPFDSKNTPGKTGSLGNICLKRSDFKRTNHPLYSCVIWGKYQDYLCSIDYVDSFGKNCIFDFLYKNHAKFIAIDVPLAHSYTFSHFVEQDSGAVTYRYIKKFTAPYIDREGVQSIKTYTMFVRDLDLNVEPDITPIENDLIENDYAIKIVINGIPYIVVPDVTPTYKPICDDILYNRARKLCKYIGQ